MSGDGKNRYINNIETRKQGMRHNRDTARRIGASLRENLSLGFATRFNP